MGKLRTLLKEFVGCLRWTTGNVEALRLFAALLRFHLAKKTARHDVLTCVQMKNPTSALSWPMQLRIFSGDLFILTEVFFDECYRLPPVITHIHPQLRLLDLGGNIGLTACYFLTTYPEAEVCSVEPDPENFSLLHQNISPFSARATAIRAAVGPHAGRGSLRPATAAHSISVDFSTHHGDVEVLTIGDILDRLSWDYVDVVKMDVEGSEWEIFNGPLNWLQRTKLLLVEFHGARPPYTLEPKLSKYGFTLHSPGALSGQWLAMRSC